MRLMFGITALFPVLGLTACAQINSSKVDQSEIHTAYSVVYSEKTDSTSVSAWFKVGDGFGGTNVRLSSPSYVEFNGDELRESGDLFGMYTYSLSRNGALDDYARNQFRYVDNDGHSHYVTVGSVTRVSLGNPTLSSDGNILHVPWSAQRPLRTGESIKVAISASDNSSFYESTESAAQSGVVHVNVERRTSTDSSRSFNVSLCSQRTSTVVDAPSAGGTLDVSYCTIEKTVYETN